MKKKSLIMLVCALVIVSSVAFGTIAYLTDRAGVKNTFTVGNVGIKVDETKVDEHGDPVSSDPADPNAPYVRTEEGNEYPLVPGSVYTKDPTMTVKAGSEEAYVRMVVTITGINEIKEVLAELKAMYPENAAFADGFKPENFVDGTNVAWVFHVAVENPIANTLTLEYRYELPVDGASGDAVLPALFQTIKVPGELTGEQLQKLASMTIDVEGHAIQTTGFVDADQAWTSFEAQYAAESAVTPTPAPGADPENNANPPAQEP